MSDKKFLPFPQREFGDLYPVYFLVIHFNFNQLIISIPDKELFLFAQIY